MSDIVVGTNPQILKWARERAGFSIHDVALAFKKDIGVIQDWEAGTSAPTYVQLEKLAYKIYKRPIAIFFFPEPPDEPDEKKSFRTLPDFELDKLNPDTLYSIRQAKSFQLSLLELTEGINPSKRLIFRDVQIDINDDVYDVTKRIREYLGIELVEQISWNMDQALKVWRDVIEDVGIYIFKNSLKQRNISGFCLSHEIFPIIYLNNSTSKSRQIFTIFHEMAHVLLQINGITKTDISYINALQPEEKAIEIYCNKFAAEFLVPSYDFDRHSQGNIFDDKFILDLANRYNVSREVILRKFLDNNLIDIDYYLSKAEEWTKEYEEFKKKGSSGGDYYATQSTYLGENYVNLGFKKYYDGLCTIDQLAEYLNMKVKNVSNLEQYMIQKTSS